MAQTDYTAGTMTLTAGLKEFTTTGAALQTRGVRSGDEIKLPATGLTLTIDTITGENSGTLTDNCPADAAGIDQAYRIRFQSDLSRVPALLAELMPIINSGNIPALAELDGTGGDKLPYLNGVSAMTTTALTAKARELLGGADATAMRTILSAQAALGYTPVNKAGDTFTGQMVFEQNTIFGGVDVGKIYATPGNATFPGFLAFLTADGSRRGFLGWASESYLTLTGDNGWGWRVPSGTPFRVSGGFLSDTSMEVRTGGAFTQQVMDAFAWATGFPVWRRVIEGSGTLSFWAYDANTGAVITTAMSLTQSGNLAVPGTITGSAKNFRIDDPLDPVNKHLVHVSIEAPEHWVRYGGRVHLVDGYAMVNIDETHRMAPGTFASFTRNAAITSLQNQNGFARVKPSPIVNGTFEIICEDPECTDEVVWEVRAERCDPFVMDDTSTDEDGYLIVQPPKAPIFAPPMEAESETGGIDDEA